MSSNTASSPSDERPKLRGRGRPRSGEGPAVSYEAIVTVAARHFGERGYAGTTVRDIANELGVSVGAVQHHLPKKDDLFRAVVDDVIVAGLLDDEPLLRHQADSAADSADVEAMVARHIERSLLRLGLPIAMLTDFDAGHVERAEYFGSQLAPIMSATRNLLGAVIDGGELRDLDLDALIAIMAIGIGAITTTPQPLATVLGLNLDDPDAIRRMTAGLSDIILHGIINTQQR